MNWTEEVTAKAKAWWLDGVSAGEIATRLGDGATRNAVLGKLHRMGVAGQRKSVPKSGFKAGSRPVKSQIHVAAKSARTNVPRAVKPKPAKAKPLSNSLVYGDISRRSTEELEAERAAALAGSGPGQPRGADAWEPLDGFTPVSLVDLDRQGQCRWPIGEVREAGFGFCGAPTHAEHVYCRTHALRAYPALSGQAAQSRANRTRGIFQPTAMR